MFKTVFQQTPTDKIKEKQLMGHKTHTSMSWFGIIQMLYLYNGAFEFDIHKKRHKCRKEH